MKSIQTVCILILYNIVLLLYSICFVFQRKLYLFEENTLLQNKESHRRFRLKAEDNSVVDLRFIDNKANIDIYLAFGNVLQEPIYVLIDSLLKKHGICCNIFMYIPKGFAGNEGIPSERSISNDLKAIVGLFNERETVKFAFGFSFGCALVLKLAKDAQFEQLVLSNPFSSLRYVVKSKRIFSLLSFALVDTWDNVSLIKKINNKITIFTSENDRIVPPINSTILMKHNEDITQILLPNSEHNDIFSTFHYKRSIADVLRRYIVKLNTHNK